MEKQTVFIKRFPGKGELPKGNGDVFSDMGVLEYSEVYGWDVDPEWWLEEIELPSDVEITIEADKIDNWKESYEFERGVNFILNHLKSKTNG